MIKHGGDWAGYEIEYGQIPLDFSANVSPLGMPEKAKKAAIKALNQAQRYPDPACRALRQVISDVYGIDKNRILCGNGALDLVYRLIASLQPKKAVLPEPTFLEYRKALEENGCEVCAYSLNEAQGFSITEDILSYLHGDCDLLVLCEPNNPTGKTTNRKLCQKIIEKCEENNILLLVDTCFADFLVPEQRFPWEQQIEKCRMVVLKAMTKFYGMAGLRLGYCFSGDEILLGKMHAMGPCWNVSSIAQQAGIEAIQDIQYAENLRHLVEDERRYLMKALEEMDVKVVPGEANFILFRVFQTDLSEKMKDKGIMVRSCGEYPGLDDHWYRIAVRMRKDNERLICALREVLAK